MKKDKHKEDKTNQGKSIDNILKDLFGRPYMTNHGEVTKFMDYVLKKYGGVPSSAKRAYRGKNQHYKEED
jgi:hypothetical protein